MREVIWRLDPAVTLVNNMNLINVDNPFIRPQGSVDPLAFIRENALRSPGAIFGWTLGRNVYVSASNLSTATIGEQNTLLFHELEHTAGRTAQQIDGPNMAADIARITRDCGTTGQAAPPQ